MTTKTGDKQREPRSVEPRVLSEAELGAVAGGFTDVGGAWEGRLSLESRSRTFVEGGCHRAREAGSGMASG